MGRLRRAAGIIGLVLIGAALAVTLRPGLLSGTRLPALGQVPAAVLTVIVLAVLGLYGLISFRVSGIDRSALGIQLDEAPELVRDPAADRVLDLDLGDTTAVRDRLHQTVAAILIRQHGYDEEVAETAIAEGEWTGDRVAAAFVDPSITYPVLERLREWFEESGTMERRCERAVRAIEELHTMEVEV